MSNRYVIMTIIEPPFPHDPIPGEAVQLRVLDLACDKCKTAPLSWDFINGQLKLERCDDHQSLNIIQAREASTEIIQQQMELFPQETENAQPVA